MPIPRAHIRSVLDAYLNEHPEEKEDLAVVLTLLEDGADLTSRKEFRGHATAGAVLVDPHGRVLHIHHRALDKWLLPGGHLEECDDSLQDAALRELTEETSIQADSVAVARILPVHIDIHPIPANDARGEPDHQHIDFRFVFRTTAGDVSLQEEEVTDFAWREIDEISDDTLRRRVRAILAPR
jgi:8-oxo-dGTP pyrophosphatase MutT (NUDIX family)